jgi:hypothetical protein
LPIALASILVFSARKRERSLPRLCALSVLFTALSLAHVVLFLTVVPCLVAAELWHLAVSRRPLRESLGMVASAAIAGLASALLGGTFASIGSGNAGSGIVFKLGIVDGFLNVLRWHLQSYALALPIALVGIFLLPRSVRFFTALLVVGCLLVLNTVRYSYSSDMVKFGGVAAIAMGLAVAALVNRLFRAMRGKRLFARIGLVGIAAGSMLGATSGGLMFAAFFFRKDATKYFGVAVPMLTPDEARAASFIRKEVRAGELVFRRKDHANGYAQWAGLPVPWSDWGVGTFGFPLDRIRARENFLKALPREASAYRAQGIDWLVLDPLDGHVNSDADRWIAEGDATELATFGALRVVKLTSPASTSRSEPAARK